MAGIRTQRVASQMKHIISEVVARELKDPRIGFMTILDVKVAADLKTANVAFSVLGTPARKRLAVHAIESARGYIQARIAREAGLKYTPVLAFHLDESAERDIALAKRIEEVVASDRRAATARAIRARAAASSIPDELIGALRRAAASPDFTEPLAALLFRLIDIDSAPRADVARAAAAEAECLRIIEQELRADWGDEIDLQRLPILPEIEQEPEYTPPAYTAPEGGAPLDAAQAYAGRANLVARLPRAPLEGVALPADGLKSLRLAFNAHVDTIGPHLPASRAGDEVLGRGACDAKGQVVTVLAALRLLRRLRTDFGVRLLSDLSAQFVIDEETGGNGSLSLALEDPFGFDGMVVCEATDLRIYTANRGAVWYRADLTAPPGRAAELAAAVILALDEEGRTLRAESDHPLFPDRPVQTNHGVFGPFGSSPSAVCDLLRLDVAAEGATADDLRAAVDTALTAYVSLHGDKTIDVNPQTGAPPLARHADIEPHGAGRFSIIIHGIAGHMGSLNLCDSAVTKAAHVILALAGLRRPGRAVHVALAGHRGDALVLEGGQGFLPTHTLRDVTERMAASGARATARFCEANRLQRSAAQLTISFDRLHNNAYVRPPDCPLAVHAEESARRAGVALPEHPAGWETSCDARLFAAFFRDRDVIVFGPGQLRHAHSPDERIRLPDIAAGATMLALLALDASGFTR